MNQTISPHQFGDRPPFLSSNFYETQQYASPEQVILRRLLDSTSHSISIRPQRTPELVARADPERKTLRTYMFDAEGRLQDAKIHLETGEVVPHEYLRTAPRRLPRPNPYAPDLEPFWMRPLPEIPARAQVAKKCADIDTSRKRFDNTAKPYFEHFVCVDDALDAYPGLDNILTGARALSLGGNTRPLRENVLFTMLQSLDVISPLRLRESMGYSKSHSEKVAMVLRVIVTEFIRDLTRRRDYPVH